MKKLFLLFLIPTFSFADVHWIDWPNPTQNADRKEICEALTKKTCILANKSVPVDVAEIKDVEVDDPEKPIYEFADSTEECSKEEPIECRRVCPSLGVDPENPELERFMELMPDNRCRNLVGFEKKLVKQLVVDEAKLAAREAAKAKAEGDRAQRENACRGFKNALENMVLTPNAPAAAIETAVRNMLGKMKNCD